MDSNELKYLWAAPENALAPQRARGFAAAAVELANRERRLRRGVLATISVTVPLATAFAAWQWGQRGIGLSEVWPAAVILAAQWIAGLALWRTFRRGPQPIDAEQPIRVLLERLLEKTSVRCRELQTVLGLFLVAGPLVSIAIFQLQNQGKMRPHEAASASVLFGAILLVVGGWLLFDLLVRKLPERRHLALLLREYR